MPDEMRAEYDLAGGVRGKYYHRRMCRCWHPVSVEWRAGLVMAGVKALIWLVVWLAVMP